MEPEGSLSHSQVPVTCPYPEPARSSPCPSTSRFLKYILILSSHLCLGLPSGLFPSLFPTKSLYAPLISPIRGTCPAPLCTRASVQVPDVLLVSQHDSFYGEELLALHPTPQAGRSPLVGFPQLLIQYIRRYLHILRPFPHPQPEDAPFSGDRDPLIMGMRSTKTMKIKKGKFHPRTSLKGPEGE